MQTVTSHDKKPAVAKGSIFSDPPPRLNRRHAKDAAAPHQSLADSARPTTQRGLSPVLTRRRRGASDARRAKAKRIFE